MKTFIASLLASAAIALAADVQILEPTGAEFAPEAPNMVKSIIRASVAQSGNTPVDGSADIQIRTSLMTMGNSIVVVCDQISGGNVVASGKQKAASLDNLDVAIEQAASQALANISNGNDAAAYAPAPSSQQEAVAIYYVDNSQPTSEDPNDKFAHKRPTRNYVSYGLGMAMWHNWEDEEQNPKMDWDQAFVFHYGRIFETSPHGAITIMNNMNISFGDYFQWHETFLIGGRYFVSTGAISPYVGGGIGLGLQTDEHFYGDEDFAFGLAGGMELGLVCFRNSAVQLEVGLAWDALWDGFDAFEQRFGAGTFYIAINY